VTGDSSPIPASREPRDVAEREVPDSKHEVSKGNFRATEVLALLGTAAIYGVLGIAVSVLLSIVSVTDRFDQVVIVISTAVTAAAAVAMYKLSLDNRSENARLAETQARSQDEQTRVMAAQQAAMEAQSVAMRENAEVASRALSRAHPPDLVVENASVAVSSDGVPVVTVHIHNRGGTTATITHLGVFDSVKGEYRTGPGLLNLIGREESPAIGATIRAHRFLEVPHNCTVIRSDDVGPVPSLQGLFSGTVPQASTNLPALQLFVIGAFEDESHVPFKFYATLEGAPGSRYLYVAPPIAQT
jgi:hypothetical protein